MSDAISLKAENSATLSLASQCSLHVASIFRLLLKVAVNGTHQCDFINFCGAEPQHQCNDNDDDNDNDNDNANGNDDDNVNDADDKPICK